jgi:hypothetical protein
MSKLPYKNIERGEREGESVLFEEKLLALFSFQFYKKRSRGHTRTDVDPRKEK